MISPIHLDHWKSISHKNFHIFKDLSLYFVIDLKLETPELLLSL